MLRGEGVGVFRPPPVPWSLAPILALVVLLSPAVLAVWLALVVSRWIEPGLQALLAPLVDSAQGLPWLPREFAAGPYGLLTMGPLLLIWAAPTVAVFSLVLALFRTSGVLDSISSSLEPWLRPFALGGGELMRVVMGFGCNVPAVLKAHECAPSCRDGCVSAISFGSACSYQLGATLAVFAAAGTPGLTVPYVLLLGSSTLVYSGLARARAIGLDEGG